MRRAAAIAAMLTLAFAVQGAVNVQQKVTTTITSAIPVTLTAGTSGTTTFNAAATSASTTLTGLVNTNAVVLKVHRVSGAWDVKVRIDSASGTGLATTPVANSAVLTEVLGVTSQLEGTATAISSTALSLTGTPGASITLSGATDLSLQVTSTHAALGTITLHMTILLNNSVATSNPAMQYSYTLVLN